MNETFAEFKEKALRDPAVRAEYEALESEFRTRGEEIKRRIKEQAGKYELPSSEKLEWMVKNVPDSEMRSMIQDLLDAAASACVASDLNVLVEMIVDWEATIEAYNNPELMKALKIRSQAAQ